MDETELLEAYKREQLANAATPLGVMMDLPRLSAVVAACQLAMRHPSFCGPTRDFVAEFIQQAREAMLAYGFDVSARLVELGNDPAYD